MKYLKYILLIPLLLPVTYAHANSVVDFETYDVAQAFRISDYLPEIIENVDYDDSAYASNFPEVRDVSVWSNNHNGFTAGDLSWYETQTFYNSDLDSLYSTIKTNDNAGNVPNYVGSTTAFNLLPLTTNNHLLPWTSFSDGDYFAFVMRSAEWTGTGSGSNYNANNWLASYNYYILYQYDLATDSLILVPMNENSLTSLPITLITPSYDSSVTVPLTLQAYVDNDGDYDQFGIDLYYVDENDNTINSFVWYSIPKTVQQNLVVSLPLDVVEDRTYEMVLSLNDSTGTAYYETDFIPFDTFGLDSFVFAYADFSQFDCDPSTISVNSMSDLGEYINCALMHFGFTFIYGDIQSNMSTIVNSFSGFADSVPPFSWYNSVFGSFITDEPLASEWVTKFKMTIPSINGVTQPIELVFIDFENLDPAVENIIFDIEDFVRAIIYLTFLYIIVDYFFGGRIMGDSNTIIKATNTHGVHYKRF